MWMLTAGSQFLPFAGPDNTAKGLEIVSCHRGAAEVEKAVGVLDGVTLHVAQSGKKQPVTLMARIYKPTPKRSWINFFRVRVAERVHAFPVPNIEIRKQRLRCKRSQ